VEVAGRSLLCHQLELLKDFLEIRIVVGFMEDEVVREALRHRRDIVFVRNSNYRNTTNVESIYLATRDLSHGFIVIDGDLWIEPCSFDNFLQNVTLNQSLIGITKAKSEEAIYVESDSGLEIHSFQLSPPTPFEWSGVAYLQNLEFSPNLQGFVYKLLEPYLPLPSVILESWEVDTPKDLEKLRTYLLSNHEGG